MSLKAIGGFGGNLSYKKISKTLSQLSNSGRFQQLTLIQQYVTDSHGWLDEEGEYEGVEEIKMVRVTFEDANLVNMLDDEVETIGYLARHTYGTDGVYQAGAAYPGGL